MGSLGVREPAAPLLSMICLTSREGLISVVRLMGILCFGRHKEDRMSSALSVSTAFDASRPGDDEAIAALPPVMSAFCPEASSRRAPFIAT